MRQQLPELPGQKKIRFADQYKLSEYDAATLTANRAIADYFETALQESSDPKIAANWVLGELSAALNENNLEPEECPVSASDFGGLLARIDDKTISGKLAREVFEFMWQGEGSADQIIEARGLKQITDSGALESIAQEIVDNNPGQAEQFRQGKEKLLGFFVGQVMQQTKGKANPAQVNDILRKLLAGK